MPLTIPPNIMLSKGLALIGYACQHGNVSDKTWVYRFRGFYGSDPVVYSKLFEDLKEKSLSECNRQDQLSIDYFLMTIYFLRCYPTELHISALFKVSEKTARTWVWFYISKIQGLKSQKVRILLHTFQPFGSTKLTPPCLLFYPSRLCGRSTVRQGLFVQLMEFIVV